jgi:hypothetical protein
VKCQLVLIAAIAAMLGSGCTGDDDDGHGNGDHHDAGQLHPDEEVRCPDDLPELFAGETSGSVAMGENGEVMARVIAAAFVPAQRLKKNVWTVELTSADGAPLEDVELVKACAYMPVHGHGKPPREVEPLAEPGRFTLDFLNFTMRGPWEVQLAVDTGSGATDGRGTSCAPGETGSDYVAFEVCVLDD